MRLAKRFWRVEIAYGEGKKLKTHETKSKTYTDERSARAHMERLRSRGISCMLYETEPVVWHISDTHIQQVEGQESLPFD